MISVTVGANSCFSFDPSSQVIWSSVTAGELPGSEQRDKRDRGVKNCIVIAAVSKTKESYHNLSIILEKLQVILVHVVS